MLTRTVVRQHENKLTTNKKMKRTFAILILIFILFACNSEEHKHKTNTINLESGFSLIQDTISINVNGRMTHALEYNDKYYVLFKQQLMKYGGYGKRWLYIFSNNQLERVIDCPENLRTVYLDFYVQNDSIILKPYMDKQNYHFDDTNFKWNKIDKTDDLIFEDSDFYVYSLDFGEWGGKTWFKDKKTDIQYILESTTPLINKIDDNYYLTNSFQILKINDPKELTKCKSDETYENIEESGKSYSWYSQSKGYEVIYKDEDVDYFTFTYHPSIINSFVFNNKLLHIYETDTASYISRIENNKIKPFEKILDDVKFFNLHYSYRSKNLYGKNELLKFNTNNDKFSGLATIKGNQIIVNYLVNKTELKPRILGAEKATEIFEKRLRFITANFEKLTFEEIESKEKKWNTFDISPNHIIGFGHSTDSSAIEIDKNKSYLIVEDSIISNSIMYYGIKKKDLVQIVTIDWQEENRKNFNLKDLTRQVFLDKYEALEDILIKEFGQPSLSVAKNKDRYGSLIWKTNNGVSIKLTKAINKKTNYNNISISIFEDKQ